MEDAHALHDDLYGLAETLRLLHVRSCGCGVSSLVSLERTHTRFLDQAKRMEVEDLETRLQRADKTSTVEFSAVQVTWRAVRARYRGFMRRRAATTTNVPVPVPRESEEAVNADAKHGEADTAVTAVRLARVFADVERSVQRLEDSVPRAPRWVSECERVNERSERCMISRDHDHNDDHAIIIRPRTV